MNAWPRGCSDPRRHHARRVRPNRHGPWHPTAQPALHVDDLDEAVAFSTAQLGTPPAKVREGYANLAVTSPPLKPVLLETPGRGETLNHLGIEVPTSDDVRADHRRFCASRCSR